MAKGPLIFNLFYLLNILLVSGAHGVNIQFFSNMNFTGLYLQSNSTAACNTFSWDNIPYAKSLITDTCLVVHNDKNCKSSWSTKHMPGGVTILAPIFVEQIASFHICNEEEGGNQLNLDITKFYHWYIVSPEVLESYKNVCSCVNVPQYVQNMSRWSINNHHNDMLAYYEPNCSKLMWNPEFIPAGHTTGSVYMQNNMKTDRLFNKTYKIQSLGPNPRSPYFQISCNSSRITLFTSTTESMTDVHIDLNNRIQGEPTTRKYLATTSWDSSDADSTTENLAAVDTDGKEQIQDLINKTIRLQAQVDQSTKNQDEFQIRILKQQTDFFNKLTLNFTQLQQEFRNYTDKVKADLFKVFA